MSMKRTINLEIAGTKFRLVVDTDEAHLRKLAATVNERVEQLGERAARTATPAQLLALVALGLADDLATSEQRLQQVEETTRRAVTHAIERIDRQLAVE
jgi:cell division protein ZapA (FtsZ GTPase activity inhibitor)